MKATRAFLLSTALFTSLPLLTAHAQPVRAVIGNSLMQARNLVQSGKSAEALQVIATLDAVPNKTAAEEAVIRQMKSYATDKMQGR
jgi:hypothetical protein